MLRNYSTYLFDVGGTLITFDSERRARAYAERAAKVGVRVEVHTAKQILDDLELEIPDRTRGITLSLLDGKIQRAFWLDLWAEGFRRLGVAPASSQALASELLDSANGGDFQAVYPDVVPSLETLHRRGKRMGVVSNFSRNCEALLRELGIAHFFDFFVVSGIIGVEKPDPRIFETAIERAGKPRAELVYIGDSIFHDIEGAHAAGLDAILLDRADRHKEFQGPRIRSLAELVTADN